MFDPIVLLVGCVSVTNWPRNDLTEGMSSRWAAPWPWQVSAANLVAPTVAKDVPRKCGPPSSEKQKAPCPVAVVFSWKEMYCLLRPRNDSVANSRPPPGFPGPQKGRPPTPTEPPEAAQP